MSIFNNFIRSIKNLPQGSVPDPEVFGPRGSGSVSQRGGSGTFHHQAKIVRKTLYFFCYATFYDFLCFKIDENAPSISNKKKNLTHFS
jgi:hypothetical protein